MQAERPSVVDEESKNPNECASTLRLRALWHWKRRRRHCDDCIPGIRVAHPNKVIVAARRTLADRAAAGDDPRNSREANRKRGATNAEHHRRNHEWVREHGGR